MITRMLVEFSELKSQTHYAMKAARNDNYKPEDCDFRRKGAYKLDPSVSKKPRDSKESQDLYFKQVRLTTWKTEI